MLYNVVLVSAKRQRESAIGYTYALPPEPPSHFIFFFLFNVYFYLCVYLTMPGLGCVVRSWFPDRESNPLPPALGVQSLSPWTTREFWVYSL